MRLRAAGRFENPGSAAREPLAVLRLEIDLQRHHEPRGRVVPRDPQHDLERLLMWKLRAQHLPGRMPTLRRTSSLPARSA